MNAGVRYIALACSIVGSPENWSDSWYWDGTYWATIDEAIEHGFETYDRSDDFNWGTVGKDGRLCHIGWMWEEREQDDGELREANRQLGFTR